MMSTLNCDYCLYFKEKKFCTDIALSLNLEYVPVFTPVRVYVHIPS